MIMKKKTYEGYKYVDGGVCAAKGFVANGINCGLNSDKNKNDLGMVYSRIYTEQGKRCANPCN